MPELPEVETIVKSLREGGRGGVSIVGKTIIGASIFWDRTLAEPDLKNFNSRIKDQNVEEIGRRGKYIRIKLSQDYLLIHLRMSGDIRVETVNLKSGSIIQNKTHDRLIIAFKDGSGLFFNDSRKFGRVWLVADPTLILGSLGPEPLDEGKLTSDIFYNRLNSCRRQIKPLLLDQKFIAGMGNIYTDEALFLAGIHPKIISGEISRSKANALLNSIRNVLRQGIASNGASIDWVYRGGSYQNTFHVYRKTNEPCSVCGTPIIKMVVGQRGTHFCPQCQPEKVE